MLFILVVVLFFSSFSFPFHLMGFSVALWEARVMAFWLQLTVWKAL